MRILHVDSSRQLQGGQHQLLLLLEGLAERGHHSTLLVRKDGALHEAAQDTQKRWIVEALSALALREWSARVDIVHTHDARAHTIAALVSKRPFLVSRRVAFPIGTSRFSRWKYKRAAGYLAVSNAAADQLRICGVPDNRIRIVFDGVPDRPYLWRWSTDSPFVTLLSSDPQKGTDLVTQAFRQLPPEIRETRALILSDALSRHLPAALAFVYLSASEGLGSAALMAMSWGVPVIAARAGGLAEVFEHEISGIYVDRSIESLQRAVTRLSADQQLAERLSAASYQHVRRYFSTDSMVEKTLAAYRELT